MKDEIIKVAEEQMRATGYEGLNFRKISEELGISKANVHHHFKNKETLALEVVRFYSQEHFAEFSKMAQEFSDDLLGFAQAMEDYFWKSAKEAGHCNICVCSQVVRSQDTPDSLKKYAQEHSFEVAELVTGVVQRAMDKGQIKSGLSAMEISCMSEMMHLGLMTMAQMMPSLEVAEELLRGKIYKWTLELVK